MNIERRTIHYFYCDYDSDDKSYKLVPSFFIYRQVVSVTDQDAKQNQKGPTRF